MANDDISQQLDEWKQKYYQSITDLEKQQSYDELLQKSLSRLALAAQGLDPLLDRQLKSLRTILRGKSSQFEIEDILDKMEKAIAKMDSEKSETLSPGLILADLLSSLKLPKAYKKDAKKLSKRLSSSAESEVKTLTPDLLTLLDKCINSSSDKPSGGFPFKLFGRGKSDDEAEMVIDVPEPIQEQDEIKQIQADNTDNVDTPTHLVLMALLERLSLPNDLSKKATKIRHSIETGIDDEQLPEIISDIADIISTLGSQAVTEKKEYEEFLKALTSRLSELDKHIRQTGDDDTKAFKERNVISQAVEQEVSGLRNHVEEANDLEQLKTSVSDRLDVLNQHFEKYQKSDHNRYTQSQKQIKALNQRIHAMEEESSALRESAEKSRELALKDALTNIWNRQALNENLEREYTRWQRYQKPLSIIIWDIDFFKRVNDNYGHAAGDKVLKTIARIFQQATRDADFIARFGGEEFVGIFPETRLEDALILANKIREKIATSKFHYENNPVPITASAGLATFRPNDTIDDVFKRADTALYRSKESGRNKCSVES
jgi:diguanylate cyclase